MSRAFLTDTERDAIRGDTDMDDNNRSTHLSRIRNKLDRMREDARLLREHEPELYEQLRDAVVDDELDQRLDRLEREVDELRDQLDDAE